MRPVAATSLARPPVASARAGRYRPFLPESGVGGLTLSPGAPLADVPLPGPFSRGDRDPEAVLDAVGRPLVVPEVSGVPGPILLQEDEIARTIRSTYRPGLITVRHEGACHVAVDRGDAAVLMHQVGRRVRDSAGTPRVLLEGIDLVVARGGWLHVAGPSGSGKSSLLRLVDRLDEASAGRIDVLGRPVVDWPVRELRRRVALVPQRPSLLGLTVRENLLLPFDLAGARPGDVDERVAALLRLVDLPPELSSRTADRLSVGQAQRVTIARALAAEPAVLLLDEPTSALDPRTAEALFDRLSALRHEHGLTILASTHRVDEARRVGGALVVLVAGRLAASGEVEDVLSEPGSDVARAFLHGRAP